MSPSESFSLLRKATAVFADELSAAKAARISSFVLSIHLKRDLLGYS